MSIRARIASAAAAAGIVAIGWQVGTANSQTVTQANPGTTSVPTATSTSTASPIASASASRSASATVSPTASASTSTGTTGRSGTFTGTTVSHHYGTVTVIVTLTDGKITSISEKVVSDGDHKSEQINSRAVPTIRQKVLSAGSAHVSTVSGATYTTQAYLTSLQSALDKAA